MDSDRHPARTLGDYVDVLRRHWRVLVAPAIVLPALLVAYDVARDRSYEANAEVVVARRTAAAAVLAEAGATAPGVGVRTAAGEALLAQEPGLLEQIENALRADGIEVAVGDATSVAVGSDETALRISAEAPVPEDAIAIANEYARRFDSYRRAYDLNSLRAARSELERQIRELRQTGAGPGSDVVAGLASQIQRLRVVEALLRSTPSQVREAGGAAKVAAQPVRMTGLGIGIGLLLGLALAFVAEALDRRIRTAREAAHLLDLPLLGRIPPPRGRRKRLRIAMISDPTSPQAEAFRILRTSVEFSRERVEAHTLLVTSALEQEGKTTTSTNLAVAFAHSGKRVILVDADLRSPSVGPLFGLADRTGLGEVLSGRAVLADALVSVGIVDPQGAGLLPTGETQRSGRLAVLPAGDSRANPGDLFASALVGELMRRLAATADLVIVDAPPLLRVNDAVELSAHVDGMIVISRLDRLRLPLASELKHVLEACPARKLGLVVTGTELDTDSRYGYGYGYGYGTPQTVQLPTAFDPERRESASS